MSANDNGKHGTGTDAVRAAINPEEWAPFQEMATPICVSSIYKWDDTGCGAGLTYGYSRESNATRAVLERKLAHMEGGTHGMIFASGMAAAMPIFQLLSSGDEIVFSAHTYANNVVFGIDFCQRMNVTLKLIDFSAEGALDEALSEKTKIVWFDSVSNPLLRMLDVGRVCQRVKEFSTSIITVVDNTFATPCFQVRHCGMLETLA